MSALCDKFAVITGARSGIGRAIAVALAEHEANLCLVGRHASELETLALQLRPKCSMVMVHEADLVNPEARREFAKRLRSEIGTVDYLIHSAGIFSRGPIAHASVDDFNSQFQTNVIIPYALTQLVLPMLHAPGGQVVFVNSTAGLFASGGISQYAATKHALKAIADSLRDEVNHQGVRVLSIYPGRTATPMQAAVHQAEGKKYEPDKLLQPEDIALVVLQSLCMPFSAEITDIRMRPTLRVT